jgi:hypothetical protein
MRKLFCLLFTICALCFCGQINYVKTANVSNTLIPNTALPGGSQNIERTYPINSEMYIADDFNHLTKIDSNYNVIYSKTLGFPLSANTNSRIAGLAGVTNNRIVMGSKAVLNNKIVSNVTFINSTDGNIIWSKMIDSVAAMSIKYKNNKISLFCCLNNYNYLINLDTTGNIISTKKIKLDYNNLQPGPPPIHSYSLSAGDVGSDSSLFFFSVPSYTSAGFKITKLDKNENLLWSYEYKTPNQNSAGLNNTRVLATKDGGILLYIVNHGKLYKIDKNGHYVWQNNYASLINHILFEKPDGKILTVSQGDDFKLYDPNGNLLLYKIPNCYPKGQERIIAPFSNHLTFIYPVNSVGAFSCTIFPTVTSYDALIYKNDYSFSGCGFGSPSIINNSTVTITKGDSSITFHPYTPSLTPISYSISNQTPTITITNDACNPVGIKENTLNGQISIYPNPSNGNLSITTKNSDIKNISIINSIGQHITTITLTGEKETIDISEFAQGLYFLNCYSLNNELIGVQKIIKN